MAKTVKLPQNAGRGDDAPRAVFSAKIDAGKSVSEVINPSGATIVGIIVPAGWTAARIQFETSVDGTTWYTIKTQTGEIPQVTGITGAGAYAVPVGPLLAGVFIRIASVNDGGLPVNQVSAAALQVVAVQ
ncbi:hypothetical protein [Hyphomicrobium sp. ghe19]|uniref:hypothetical protein n=1 Tax=Hyphomicrobium sp. ghe19 TaxID=2682968 RepID=UPI001366DF33|nr:hypothetical protein HYPP_02420 [Hyphomicrobium sp. ghe19]